MSNIDERVVSMQFNNKQFEANASATLSTLEKLKASLNFDAANKGLADLSAAGKNLNLTAMGDNVDGISGKFAALAVIGVTALAKITSSAIDAGARMIKSLTLDPIMSGFGEYEIKMGSIQTILANTARYGTQLPEVTAALDELNAYADDTIYNFGDMTKNIGLFTNAGMRIEDATSMIQGFSNAAAASGTNAQGAASAAYQLSQAMSAGTIRLMDWRSLTNVGMGNKNMQDGLIQIAQAMGTFNANTTDATRAQTDFNGSLETGWLSADVMGNYLKIMAGDMDDAAMAALGLSQAQIDSFKATQATAEEAATKVRTWTQLYGTLKEAVGSSWSESFNIVIGDFNEATELFTGISDTLGGVIGRMGEARNAMLQGWKDLGGRQDLIDIGKNIWDSINNIIAPIKNAWNAIFPPDGGSALKGFTGAIRTITEVVANVTSGLSRLQPVFEVVFGVFKIGVDIIKGVVQYFVSLFAILGGAGTGSVLGLVGGFAALLARVVDFVNQGQYVQKFFDNLIAARTAVLEPLIDFFGRIGEAVKLLFSGDVDGFFNGIKGSLQAFAPLIDSISDRVQAVGGWFMSLSRHIQNLGVDAQGPLGTIGRLLATAAGYLSDFANGFRGVSDILTRGEFAGSNGTFGLSEDSKVVEMLFSVREAFVGVSEASDRVSDSVASVKDNFTGVSDAGNGVATIWERISDAFAAVGRFLSPAISKIGEFLSWIGQNVKRVIEDLSGQDMLALVNTGLFMAAYLSVKRFMDSFRTMFDSAAGSFDRIGDVFDALSGHLEAMQNNVKANTLLAIALAIGVLAASVWVLTTIDIGALSAATVAIVVLMKALMMTMESFTESVTDTDTVKILALGVALTGVAFAILILSAALKVFSSMDLAELLQGTVTLALILEMLSVMMERMPEDDILRNAGAMVVMALAMQLMAVAILAFSAMDVGTIAEGLGYIAAALGVLIGAMQLMPEADMVRNAAAMAILAATLQLLAVAILAFSAMDVGTVAEGLGYIAAALLVLAVGMRAMRGTQPAAAALLVISAALIVLSVALKALGSLDIQQLGIALLAIVGVIAVFAIAALALSSVIPIMAALAAVMALLGVGLLAAGAGMALFATAFVALGAAGVAGAAGFTAAMMAVLELLPLMAQQLGLAVLAFAAVIAEGGPAIVAALTTLILSLIEALRTAIPPFIEMCVEFLLGFLDAVNRVAPTLIDTTVNLIMLLVDAIVELVPFLVDAGLRLLTGIINGINDNIQQIIDAGKNLVISFITGIGEANLEIIEAAMDTIITFVKGLATAIETKTRELEEAGWELAKAIVDGIVGGLGRGIRRVVDKARELVAGIPDAIKDLLHIQSPSKVTTELGEYTAEGLVVGLDNMKRAVYNAATNTGETAMDGISRGLTSSTALSSIDIDVNPVIKPVLDLTDVEAGASQLEGLLTTKPISVTTSTSNAQSIAASVRDDEPRYDDGAAGMVSSLTLVQNNYSPEALSSGEIYRQTNNQLSQIKERLPG